MARVHLRRRSRLAAVITAIAMAGGASAGVVRAATPDPTPRLAPAAHLRSVAGMSFRLTPYAFGAWPNRLGFFAPAAGAVPLTGPNADNPAPRDANGVRMIVREHRTFNDPVDQAQDAFAWLARYRSDGTADALTLALRDAQRLIDTHRTFRATGSAWWFPYPFIFDEYGSPNLREHPPWYSGMAQGEALDVFTQLFAITGAPKWKLAAQHAFTSFLYPLRPGQATTAHPWVDRVVGHDLWIEEFPLPNPNDHTINGFGFALIGLTDYARMSQSATAQLIAEGGLATWLHAIPKVRHPGAILGYSLSHPGDRAARYHRIVVGQLTFLGGVTGDPQFTQLAGVLTHDFH